MPEGKSEIPADILATATVLAGEIQDDMSWRGCRDIVALALLAERRRCIKAAEAIQARSDDYNGAFDGIADVIEAIRTPPFSTEENLQHD